MNNNNIPENDLFDYPVQIPAEVMEVLNKYDELSTYKELEQAQKELNAIGYTFDYYLDAVPYNLRKI